MKRISISVLCTLCFVIGGFAQTLNVQVGNVTYRFPAAEAGSMPYENGTTLTVMGKSFILSEVDNIFVDETAVQDSTVSIVYNGSSAAVTVAGNIARFLTVTQSGAHVSVAQSDDLATEVTYRLSGTSTDGEFYTSGSYKASLELNGVTLTNTTPVYSGAAIHVQNSKRIDVKVVTGTTNTLRDASTGSQKGALYIKGHAEFKQKGTLNVYGNLKHGIKTGEYISVKNATINVLSSVGDGINCEQYFLMESGAITLSGIGDDGLQCDIENTATGSTGQTTGHEGEDSGNIYISGGSISVNCQYKGIKAEGDLTVSDGLIAVTSNAAASSNGNHWGGGSSSSSSPEAIESKGAMTISGGQIYASSADDALNAGGHLTISGGLVYAHSTSNDGIDSNGNCYIKGGLVFAISATSPELGIDANTEGGYKLYVQGGTIVAIGGLESGASLTQTCYKASSWSRNTWYSLTVGSDVFAFKTPSSGGSTMVVSGASTPTLQSGVSASGTSIFEGEGYYPATATGGSSVSLSSYTGGGGGPGGGGHGGGGRW
ncbi:MAG: carbohydrate-binding domain-containing protein [Paludibacteraceae bacterium]|nr:carbohydrate-binding domain-containing protein [Paludibacteraceae bacterium]